MSPQDVQAYIKDIDTQLNKRVKVPDEQKKLSITKTYKDQYWPPGSPLSDSACTAFALEDRADDNRWNFHFQRSKREIGLYRSKIGFYWVLIVEGSEHSLEHVGSASDVIAKYGNNK